MQVPWEVVVFATAVCVVSVSADYGYETRFFETKVDHFGYANNDTYKMRYLFADQYWDHQGGPIFFYTGNEGSITTFANNSGLMWDWAPEFRALLIFAEHRYYGKSMPYGKDSFKSPAHLGYLTVEQALADYADLLQYLRKTLPGARDSQVISFGGSYGGMLAAWFRMKYPHVTAAALAASAPILQFQDITPCGAQTEGAQAIGERFHLCGNYTSKNFTNLRDWLTDLYANLAMVNYPYDNSFLAPVPGHPVREACKFLNRTFDNDDALLEGLYQAISIFQNYTGQTQCNDLSKSTGTLDADGWNYQSCNEMVMPLCSDGVNDMFDKQDWDLNEVRKKCERDFHVTPDVHKAELIFGGRNIAAASNIIFSNGDLDPWSAGGVLETISDSLIAIYMEGAAHHLDLRSSNPADPESVVKARALEKKYITKWLREATSI
ncbi:hypothetical protein MTO96_047922 [Rhipicephalus appendiculatus]